MFRVLIVDDDPATLYLLQDLMKNVQREHELYGVKSGVEALEFLRGRLAAQSAPLPDLILLDLNMPQRSGLDTLAAIKSDPEQRSIPVIILSTSSSRDDVRKSYESHANCYVQKPTDWLARPSVYAAVRQNGSAKADICSNPDDPRSEWRKHFTG